MFRTNYLPKGNIYKKSENGKYFIVGNGGPFRDGLVRVLDDTGEPEIEWAYDGYGLVYYDTIDELLNDLYRVAAKRHTQQLHRDITYSKGIKV